ncbi:MAG: 4Fe-4S binding protein [Archaeoglobaceae archaeon]|nr:4Fe-4S binding protein [Archaeoglobaceae archaeon]
MLLLLKFDSKAVKQPIISKAAIDTNTLINIIKASVGARRGELIVEVEDEKVKEVEKIFKSYGVEVQELDKAIAKDDEKCVHCGLCISICPVEVFEIKDKKVVAETSKCIHCGVCINVCPTRALSLPV